MTRIGTPLFALVIQPAVASLISYRGFPSELLQILGPPGQRIGLCFRCSARSRLSMFGWMNQ